MASLKSNFHRTQSKVWWGSMNDHDPYRFLSLPETTNNKIVKHQHQHSNTSTDEFMWNDRRDSPGSLKSQDSGFADSDHSINLKIKSSSVNSSPRQFSRNISTSMSPNKLTPKKNVNNEINAQINQRSPSICSDRQTPPTVIRKKLNTDLRCSPRRISFSEPNSPVYDRSFSPPDLHNKIDSLNYSTTSPLSSNAAIDEESPPTEYKFMRERSIKRGSRLTLPKRINRKIFGRKSPELLKDPEKLDVDSLASIKSYQNETVYFGYGVNDSNNNIFNKSIKSQRLPTYDELYPNGTSTPKNGQKLNRSGRSSHGKYHKLLDSLDEIIDLSATMNWDTCTYIEYTNPALNGHASSVQFWLDETRTAYCHEVLSTLQTKSVAQVAARTTNICSVTSGKIVRQLQYKAMELQNHFECVEKMMSQLSAGDHGDEMLVKRLQSKIIALFETIIEFVNKTRKRNIFRAENDMDVKKFDDNMNSISDLVMDLHKNVTVQPIDIEIKELLEDILIIKRYLLITLQMIFEKLIKIIVDRIDETKCDLILRSNLTMISMLSNIEYMGFSSLNDAFRATGAIKVLLTICVGSHQPLIRALSLRALATVCSTKDLIRQFEQAEGVEILKDILSDNYSSITRTDAEFREAVSVLTQITAPWHGRLHPIEGIRFHIESIVESLTKLLDRTTCSQTLLLCAACLNNLSKMEVTTSYSIMSNETLFKLENSCAKRGRDVSIFLHEQISSILLNMAAIKKCHSHLAHKDLIAFITQIFQLQFNSKYNSKAENDAHHHTIKNILYIFSRLIHESIVGQDILENNVIPVFSRIEQMATNDNSQTEVRREYFTKDISSIVKKLNDSVLHRSHMAPRFTDQDTTRTSKLSDRKLLESYV